jgi:hypothetical protein
MPSRYGPLLFYRCPEFEGERAKPIHTDYSKADIQLFGATQAKRAQYLGLLEQVQFDRFGVLKGEYALITEHLIVDRNGRAIAINLDGDDPLFQKTLLEFWESAAYKSVVDYAVANWDIIPSFGDIPLLAEPWYWNYFHYTLLLAPKMRFFPTDRLFIRPWLLETPAQCSLMARVAIDHRLVSAPANLMKVVDPMLAQSSSLKDSVAWLRERVKLPVQAGSKRFYIRRSASNRRTEGKAISGAIWESDAFLGLLSDFGFEFVEAGNGGQCFEDQVMQLNGAEVILSPHGATLTNLAFLSGPLSLIEILPPLAHELNLAVYMEIAAALGARYRGIVTDDCDTQGRLIVNCDLLSEVLTDVCGPASRTHHRLAAAG